MDDILKAPLWQKILAAAVLCLFLVWLYYSYFYLPKAEEISSLKATLRSIEQEIALIAPPETILKEGMDVKDILKKELAELMKKIPTDKEVPSIVDAFISLVGSGLNIDYRLIQPLPLAAEGKYFRLPMRIEFNTDYSELNLYIKQLKNLPTIVRIDNLSLNKTSDPPKLRVNMMLSAFVMSGTPLAKEGKPTVETKPYLFDPFFRATEIKDAGKEKKKPAFELQGVWSGKTLKAFINDKALSVGESILDHKVISITRDEVVLLKDGNRLILKLEGRK